MPTYDQLVSDSAEWTLRDIERELDVSYATVRSWRLAGCATPLPVSPLPARRGRRYPQPVWPAGQIRRWAMQTGLMTAEGTPTPRAARRPTSEEVARRLPAAA